MTRRIDKALLFEFHVRGMTDREIAAALASDIEAIRSARKRMCLPPIERPALDRDRILSLRCEGLSVAAIARAIGRSASGVRHVLRRQA